MKHLFSRAERLATAFSIAVGRLSLLVHKRPAVHE